MSPGPKRRPAGGKGPDVDAVVPRTWTLGQAQTGRHSPGHMAFGWRGWRWTPSCGCPVLPELLCAAPPPSPSLCPACTAVWTSRARGPGPRGCFACPEVQQQAPPQTQEPARCPRWLVLSQAAVWARPRPSLPGGAAGSGGGPGGEGKGQAARCSACHRGTPPGGFLEEASGWGVGVTWWPRALDPGGPHGQRPACTLGWACPAAGAYSVGGDGAPEPGRPQGARLSSREGHCLPGRPCRELSRARRFWVWMVPGGAWPACHPACPSPGSW